MQQQEVVECAAPSCSETFVKSVWNQRYHDPECKQEVKNLRRRSDGPVHVTNPHKKSVSRSTIRLAPASPAPVEEEEDEDQVEFLRRENKRLGNLYYKHKYNSREQTDALYRAAFDAISKIEIVPVKPPKLNKATGQEEIANPVVADWQIGKKTPSYNTDVCRERIAIFGDKIETITEIQRSDHPVKDAHLHALGDMVEGEDIFPGQSFQIDSSLYSQVVSGVEVFTDLCRRLLSIYETVHVAAVIGNHGLLSSKRRGQMNSYNPETNMDRLLYKMTQMIFENANEKRISFDIPDGDGESSFYTVDKMGQYKVLLMHGDQLGQPTSQHSYYKKVLGWKDSGISEDFDDVFIGHWHQNTKSTFGTVVLRIAGTPESDNTYAQERLGVMGRPSQHLQFVDPNRGVTAEYDIYLD